MDVKTTSGIHVEAEIVMATETPAEIAKRLEQTAQNKTAQDKASADQKIKDGQAKDGQAPAVVNNDPVKRDQENKPKVAPPSSPADAPKSVEISRQVDQVKDPAKPTTPQSVTVKEGEHQRDVKGSEGGSQNPATLSDIKDRNREMQGMENVLPAKAEGIGRSGSTHQVVTPLQAPPEQAVRSFQSAPPQKGQIEFAVMKGTNEKLPFEVVNNESRVARAAFATGEDATKFSEMINKK